MKRGSTTVGIFFRLGEFVRLRVSRERRDPASLSEKKLTADSRARRVLPLAQATNSRRDGRWDASILPITL